MKLPLKFNKKCNKFRRQNKFRLINFEQIEQIQLSQIVFHQRKKIQIYCKSQVLFKTISNKNSNKVLLIYN